MVLANSLFKSPRRNQKLLPNPGDRCRHTFMVLREAGKPQGMPNKRHEGGSTLASWWLCRGPALGPDPRDTLRGGEEKQQEKPPVPTTVPTGSAAHSARDLTESLLAWPPPFLPLSNGHNACHFALPKNRTNKITLSKGKAPSTVPGTQEVPATVSFCPPARSKMP